MTIKQAFKDACQVIEADRQRKKDEKQMKIQPAIIPASPVLTREQWLEARRAGIGASDAAAVLGMGASWGGTALQVYLDKTGQLPAQPMNLAMRRGIALEPIVADLYTEATGRKLIIPPALQKHSEYPFIMANPDRYTVPDDEEEEDGEVDGRVRNVQLKTTSRHTPDWGTPGTDECPDYYIAQVQHEMFVSGLQVTDLAVWFQDNNEFAIFTIPRNNAFIETMVEIETEFWKEHVEKHIPPEPDFTHPSTPRLIKLMYPGISDGKVLEVPPEQEAEIIKTIEMMQESKALKTRADNEVEQHKAFLLSMMEDAAQMICGSRWTLTRKGGEKPEYTVKASSYVMLQVKDNEKPKATRKTHATP